jgi:hypothetical protein
MASLITRLALLASILWSGFGVPASAQYTKPSLTTQIQNCFPAQTIGAIWPPILVSCLTNLINSYQQFPGVNPQVGTSYAFQATDYGQLVTFNNVSPIAVSLPRAGTPFFPFNVYASNLGAGAVTITPPAGILIGGNSSATLATGQSIWIVSDGGNYVVVNNGSSGVFGTLAFQNANDVDITGGIITGLPTPSLTSDAATKAYVDAAASAALTPHTQAVVGTTAALPANTYSNGTAGVGATLTANANGILTIDGMAPTINKRILVKNEAAPANNGIYTLTTVGTSGAEYVLTRATDANTAGTGNPLEIGFGTYVLVTAGTVNINSGWSVNSTVTTIGSSAINWAQFSAGATPLAIGAAVTGSTPYGILFVTSDSLGNTAAGTAGYFLGGNGSSNPTFQGFLQSGTGAVTRTWQSKAADVVSVADFGAACNGSTDDTTAIAAAIAAVPIGGKLVFPPGQTCIVSGSGASILTRATPILIDCQGATIIPANTVPSTTNLFLFKPTGSGGFRKWHLSYCILPMGYGFNSIVIDTTATTTTEIAEFEIDHVSDGPTGSATGASILVNNELTNTNGGTYNTNFHDNVFSNGILLTYAGDSIRVKDNILTGTKYGVAATLISGAGGLIISGNNMTAACPISVNSSSGVVNIINNEIEQTVTNTCPNGAMVDLQDTGSVQNVNITGNEISANVGTATSYGIYVANAGLVSIDNNEITSAVSGTTCIHVASGTVRVGAGNYISCTSATSGTVATVTTHAGYP